MSTDNTKPTVPDYSFPRSRRLHGDKIIQQIRKEGLRKYSTHLSLFYLLDERQLQVGFAVSKRCGNAVVRNRIKRLLREYVRHRFDELPTCGCLLIGAHQAFHSLSPEILLELDQLKNRILRAIVKLTQ